MTFELYVEQKKDIWELLFLKRAYYLIESGIKMPEKGGTGDQST